MNQHWSWPTNFQPSFLQPCSEKGTMVKLGRQQKNCTFAVWDRSLPVEDRNSLGTFLWIRRPKQILLFHTYFWLLVFWIDSFLFLFVWIIDIKNQLKYTTLINIKWLRKIALLLKRIREEYRLGLLIFFREYSFVWFFFFWK